MKNVTTLHAALCLMGLSLIVCPPAPSQVTPQWVRRYNGAMNGVDGANAVAADDAGNVYVTGRSLEGNTFGDITTIKYDAAGNQVWIDRYTVAGVDHENAGIAIAVQPAALGGNVFVTGHVSTVTTIGDDQDIVTIKYSPSGVRRWVRTYSYLEEWGTDGGLKVAPDPFGNIFVLGFITGDGTLDDIATIKYDSAGTMVWVQTYTGASATDIPRALAVDTAGDAYIASSSFSFWGSATFDFTTIHYTPGGIEQWLVIYNGPAAGNDDQPMDIAVDGLQNTYVTGYVDGVNGSIDFATIKQNNYGTRLWAATYNGAANGPDSAVAVGTDASGNVYVTGTSLELSGTIPAHAITTIKYTPDGVQLWRRSLVGEPTAAKSPAALKVDGAGNILVAGFTTGGTSGRDILMVKYDSAGTLQWTATYNGPGNDSDVPAGLAVDQSGRVYVTGTSWGGGTSMDYVTICYSEPPTGVPGAQDRLPGQFALLQNYPNPFNPTTQLEFRIAEPGLVSLNVYDLLGREVAILVNEVKPAGAYSVRWDASNVGSGTYFYRLESNGRHEIRKMLLMK